jgi:hypothetical protein
MRKMSITKFIAAAVLAGSAGAAIVGPAAMAGAGAPKPPVRVTCTALFGQSNATAGGGQQLLSGCVGSGSPTKAKVTPYGVEVPAGGTVPTSATVYWTNKDITTLTLGTINAITPDPCPAFMGISASLDESVASTVSGGTSKLTVGDTNTGGACVYIVGSNVLIVGGSSTL